MEKYELLPQQLILEGTCKKEDFFEPDPVSLEKVNRVKQPVWLQVKTPEIFL